MNEGMLLAIGILSTSFLGSWHCAAMCGPIACLMGERKSLLAYHLGRLTAYVVLGVIAGSLGQVLLDSQYMWLRTASAILFAFILLSMGLRLITPRLTERFFPQVDPHGLMIVFRKLRKFHLNQSGFIVGALTGLLPCGWLYTYVTAAVALQSPMMGGALMFLFWVGGLPSLSVLPSMIRNGLRQIPLRQQRIAGSILILASVYSVWSFIFFNHH
ncbi:sulfite exporter TauE/SafE family protein [Bdellovibrio sp. SKB1291214]|uniref:sulfite exporter TauE/SafE family protein n=1 Tax=Bdellovibrio sp. SKB1291214 TaxID=1732569 RepID=UPI000B519D4D|nr:sulfite exporter TauE/SafE family protein [Bdellovibrio sp. SKB1291214]UYL07763.1 sulfite exporter TauE/SafE family protein [Bdellovibrio sp. SKB1291214]